MSDEPESSSSESSEEESFDLAELRTSRRVSWLLDECIRIPGTSIRFGFDPILGLFPFGGESVATVIGASILGEAGKKGVPFKSLTRMGGNMLVNAGVGTIPVIGDLFSVWFKSNLRNYKMLNAWMESEHGDEKPIGWGSVIVVFLTIAIVLTLNIASWILMSTVILRIYREFTGLVVGMI